MVRARRSIACLYSAGHPVPRLNDISQTDKQQKSDSGRQTYGPNDILIFLPRAGQVQ